MAEQPGAPFTAYIGALLEEKAEGYSRLSLKTDTRHADASGCVHPGVLTSVMDSVIGIGLSRLRGDDAREKHGPHATIGMSTSFYAQATPGDELVFEGRVIRLTDRVAFGEVETRRTADGEMIAKAHLTFAIPVGQGPSPDEGRRA
ncbi:MAG: PaaI family thioesterase [Chloroflexota bacterium]